MTATSPAPYVCPACRSENTRYDHEDAIEYPQAYCDYCEREGHTFSACPARDDEYAAEAS